MVASRAVNAPAVSSRPITAVRAAMQRAGVQARVEVHQRHPGFLVPRQQGSHDRARASPSRQEREMDVEKPPAREWPGPAVPDQGAVRGDDPDVDGATHRSRASVSSEAPSGCEDRDAEFGRIAAFTGEGIGRADLPRGRSGRVMTVTTSAAFVKASEGRHRRLRGAEKHGPDRWPGSLGFGQTQDGVAKFLQGLFAGLVVEALQQKEATDMVDLVLEDPARCNSSPAYSTSFPVEVQALWPGQIPAARSARSNRAPTGSLRRTRTPPRSRSDRD